MISTVSSTNSISSAPNDIQGFLTTDAGPSTARHPSDTVNMKVKKEEVEDDGAWLLNGDTLYNPMSLVDSINSNWNRKVEDVIPKGIQPTQAPNYWGINLLEALVVFSEITKEGTANAVSELAAVTKSRWRNLRNKLNFPKGIPNDPRLLQQEDVEVTINRIMAQEAQAKFQAENLGMEIPSSPVDFSRGKSSKLDLPSIDEMRRRTGMTITKHARPASPCDPTPKGTGIVHVKPLQQTQPARRRTSPPKREISTPDCDNLTDTPKDLRKMENSAEQLLQEKEDADMVEVYAQYGLTYCAERAEASKSASESSTTTTSPDASPKRKRSTDFEVSGTTSQIPTSKRRKSSSSVEPTSDDSHVNNLIRLPSDSPPRQTRQDGQVRSGRQARINCTNPDLPCPTGSTYTPSPHADPFKQQIPADASPEYLRAVIEDLKSYHERRNNELRDFMHGHMDDE